MPIFDFEKHTTVDTMEVVPEVARPLYMEKDGKFSLNPAFSGFVSAYSGESKALEKTRADLKKANEESASRRVTGKAVVDFLKGRGVDTVDEDNPLTTLEAYTTDLIAAGKKGGEVNVNMAKVKEESERRIAEVNTAADTKIGKMQANLNRYLISQAATSALAEAGGSLDLLLPIVTKAAKVVQDGDDFVVRIVDDAGEVRSNGAGGYMDFKGFVSELKTKPSYQPAFKSEAKGGSGHQPGSGQQRTQLTQAGEKTSVQKIKDGLLKQQNNRASL